MEAVGMPRLPCLSSLAVCPVGVTSRNRRRELVLDPKFVGSISGYLGSYGGQCR